MPLKTSHTVHALPYPALDPGNLSFPDGSYDAHFEMGRNMRSVEISHEISGAPFLEELISDGLVNFCCMLSVAKSGFRKLYKTGQNGVVQWEDSIAAESPKLRPLLVYNGDKKTFKLDHSSGVAEVWQGREIVLPNAARVARGLFRHVHSSRFQLLQYNMKPEYAKGTYNIEANSEEGFHFDINAAEDIFDIIQKPGAQIMLRRAILSGIVSDCFSYLRIHHNDESEPLPDNLQRLSDNLHNTFGYDWTDPDFDPVLTATRMYPVDVPNLYTEEEGD